MPTSLVSMGVGVLAPQRAWMLREAQAATEPSESKEVKSKEGVRVVGEVDCVDDLFDVLKFPSGKCEISQL